MLRPSFPLHTERLLLRPFSEEDLEALYTMQSREDVTRYLYWGPRSQDEARHMLERLIADDSDRRRLERPAPGRPTPRH